MEKEFSIHPENPEDYLKDKLETEKALPQEHLDWFSEAQMPCFEDIGQPVVSGEGSVSFRQRYHEMEFSICLADIEDSNLEHPKIQKFIAEQQEARDRKDKRPVGGLTRIDRLIIYKGQERVFGLTDLLPNGRYFLLINRVIGNVFDSRNKVICISDISSPDGIIGLMHEAGHSNIYESLNDTERGALRSALLRYREHYGSDSDFATVLKHERDAWAWALKKIRPILGNNSQEGLISKTQLIKFVHKIALQTYGERIAKEIARIAEKDIEKVDNIF